MPGIVERTLIRPPGTQLGPITGSERQALMTASPMQAKYGTLKDRKSAFEILQARADQAAQAAAAAEEQEETQTVAEREFATARRYSGGRVGRSSSRVTRQKDTFATAMSEAVIKELKGTTGRRIVRGILGGLFKAR